MRKLSGSPGGEMRIMDASGHQCLQWHTGKPEEIAQAEALFERLILQGYVAFGSSTADEAKHVVTRFDPSMEDVVMVPRIVGG